MKIGDIVSTQPHSLDCTVRIPAKLVGINPSGEIGCVQFAAGNRLMLGMGRISPALAWEVEDYRRMAHEV